MISLCIIYLYESRDSDETIWTFAFSQDEIMGTGFILPLKLIIIRGKILKQGFSRLHRRQKGQRSLKERRSIKQKESSRDLQSVQQSHYRSLLISACMWEHCMKLQGPPERSGGRLFRAHRALGVDCVHTRAENW